MREKPSPAVHASPNAFSLSSQTVRSLLIAAAAAVVLAYLGAMGTNDAPLATRLGYWLAVIMPGSLLGMAVSALVRGIAGLASRRWLEILLVALLVSLPHSFIVIVVSAMFFGMAIITPMMVLQFWLAVLLITLVITAINYLASADAQAGTLAARPPVAQPAALDPVPATPDPAIDPHAAATSAPAADRTASQPALPMVPPLIADKLPPGLRGAGLRAIEAEDHYLRVHTDVGSALILMRMVDACALLADTPGERVHRSWWVASAAVTGIDLSAGRMTLKLGPGLQAPVSRSMHSVVQQGDWLAHRAPRA